MTEHTMRESSGVTRTERGLVIAGTRVTLYLLLDYVLDQWPAHLIAEELQLSPLQVEAALTYIRENKEAVMAEYAQVLRQTEDLRRYYAERNRPYIERIQKLPETPQRRRFRELQRQTAQRIAHDYALG
ncbi:MAG TPA: DUF433 domain-containing protein [Anaerolineae bacterium]|nr:DUF433 domain-containing protein [Anaerolineae bacterium]HQI86018.1 DUF433 domain-containing protein [Anaerolineae bacterium]